MASTLRSIRLSVQKILGDFSAQTQTDIDRWINDGRNELWEIVPGNYKEKTDYLTTVLAYSTGTCSVTKGATTVTGVGTVWTSAMAKRFIQINDTNPWYRIASVTSNTELELEDAYIDTTAAAGSSYEIKTYLNPMNSDVQRLLQVTVESEENWTPLIILDRIEFYSEVATPLRWDQGISHVCWIDEETDGGLLQMGIYPPTSTVRLVKYRYEAMPTDLSADGDTVDIPAGEHAIKYHALVSMYSMRDKPQMMAFYEQKLEKALARLLGSQKRSRHIMHRRRDHTNAHGVERYVNLGANFPRPRR